MLLWVVFASMSAAVVVALLHPLLRRRASHTEAAKATTAVYRDQLAEIDADAKRGLIATDEAEAARHEIARRIIASSSPTAQDAEMPPGSAEPTRSAPGRRRVAIAAATAVAVPLAALLVYSQTGAPGLPAQPIAARRATPPVNAEMAKLIAAVEARLKEHPEDGRGWDVIAPVYLRLGRYVDAADAYGRALRILGDSVGRLSGLADAVMLRDDGRVSEQAKSALTRLLQLEPGHVQARFWLAVGKEQDGRLAEAAADYAKLLENAPADVSWRPMVEKRLEAVRGEAKSGTAEASAARGGQATPGGRSSGGPTAEDVSAAARMSPSERQAMINNMVTGLAERLDKDGRDLEGWRKLIRALTVLGRKEEAVAALGRARKSLADQPQALAALADLAKSLGLGT
ncbi:MAG: c-type cytochrome biogenesis protein CcmI [Hyphomicrobiaceae bacterium]